MYTELFLILKSGKIENEGQANFFADNARFYEMEDGRGDFRIELFGYGFAEIYGNMEKTGDEEEMPVADSEQAIRFYDREMNMADSLNDISGQYVVSNVDLAKICEEAGVDFQESLDEIDAGRSPEEEEKKVDGSWIIDMVLNVLSSFEQEEDA